MKFKSNLGEKGGKNVNTVKEGNKNGLKEKLTITMSISKKKEVGKRKTKISFPFLKWKGGREKTGKCE